MKVSKLHSQLFLLFVVLIIYFPAISGTINTVDDVHIINAYGINGQRTLQQILLPGNQFYFRPLVELTYYFDNYFWGLNPRMMHLENVFLHALNVLLVFHIAARVALLSDGFSGFPFISSLLFAVHPINSEAVDWIAGRTDLLAAVFILLSLLFLFTYIQSANVRYYYGAFAAMLVSFLAKETSVMLIPVSFLIVYSVNNVQNCFIVEGMRTRRRIVVHYCLLLVVMIAYVAVRLFLKPAGTDNAFSTMFHQGSDLIALLRDFTIAAGFYVKKLFIPFPLNFAIHTISKWYGIIGLAVVISVAYLIRKRDMASLLLLACLMFIFPAVIVKLVGLTWTPVAERYLYVPSAFFCMGISCSIAWGMQRSRYRNVYYTIATVAVVITAGHTFKRNLIWQDNLTLYKDAVNKSPDFGDIHNELGIALAKNGDIKEARKHFLIAEKLSERSVIRELAQFNVLNCDLEGKSIYEKSKIIEKYISTHKSVNPEILKILRNIKIVFLQTESDTSKRVVLTKEAIGLNDRIFSELKDPVYLYNNGKLMLTLGDNSAALMYFRRTVAIAAPDAFYYSAAQKLISDLETK